jgi:hypothetical protein
MADQPSLSVIVGEVLGGVQDERQKAVALHDWVREAVPFGFNKYFDAAKPEDTLACGRGHGNPKSRLMAALFRAAGFECCQHFVVIPKTILQDALPSNPYWLLPPEISHSFVEVRVEGWWCRIDSFILDTPLLRAVTARLRREGRQMGYGSWLGATNTWDGREDAFSQFSEDLMIEDHGRVPDPEAYLQEGRYRNKAFGISMNMIFRLMGARRMRPINDNLDRIRRLGWVDLASSISR